MSEHTTKAGGQLPTKSYEPTQRERDVVRNQIERDRQDPPPPKVKFNWNEKHSCYGWAPDHPDLLPATLLLNQALGARNEALGRGLLGQMASVAGSNELALARGGDAMADTMNFMVAMVKGLEPKDTLEVTLAAQMASVHVLTMRLANQLASSQTLKGQEHAERAFNKLTRTFAAQVETLKRYRTGGEQKVTVQHVSVSDHAQAIVGNVSTGGGCNKKKSAGGGD